MNWLKERRLDLNYTQEQIAQQLGISKRQYIRYEANERDIGRMELDIFLKLTQVLHYSVKQTLELANK